jgi:glycosyltransferase involved in cell wall biosynthesis
LKPLKVLFVIDGLGTGGAERSLAEMLPGLVESGITPVVACLLHRSEGIQDRVLEQGFDVRFVDGNSSASGPRALIARVCALRKMIRSERPDIVHTAVFQANIAGRLASVWTRATVMTSLVNTNYAPVRLKDPHIRPARLKAVQLVDGATARHMTRHFHALTQAVKDHAVAALRIPPQRITVVWRGRDPARLGEPSPARRRRARSALNLRDDDQVLINVGRREFQKGQRYLLEALATLVLTHERIILLIAGRGGAASHELEELRDRLGLANRVRFLNHREDVPELLAASDLFVFPSVYEGFGGALVEAMALGLPIVASDIPSTWEVVEGGRNAILVQPESAQALAGAIGELLQDQAKSRAFGARGREIFFNRFTLQSSVTRMVQLYREVLQAAPSDRVGEWSSANRR